MSYIYIDFDEARRVASAISSRTEGLRALIGEERDELNMSIAAFCDKLEKLSGDLLSETEACAAIDEKMKLLHHITNDERGGSNG